jgi:transposase
VVLGRSDRALGDDLSKLPGREQVRLVCMDLSGAYWAIVKKYFPNPRIVADRFDTIRLINQRFLALWRELDPAVSKNRGLISLMRRHRHNLKPEQLAGLNRHLAQHPFLALVLRLKQHLCYLLLKKHRTRKQCRRLMPRLLKAIDQLHVAGPAQLVTPGETLHARQAEIAAKWRFTRNNDITEGFHTKMEVMQRQAYGFRNFNNYRMRVKILCE